MTLNNSPHLFSVNTFCPGVFQGNQINEAWEALMLGHIGWNEQIQ